MLNDLDSRLARCTLEDRAGLRRRVRRLKAASDGAPADPRWVRLERDLRRSEELFERRRASVPPAAVPPELPIAAAAEDIVAAIREHPVVIVCGDTGCGKSTQLPKLCLLAGRGVAGQIAHTQPRRVAARAVARRIAEELAQPLGKSVGFKVRFDARVRRESHIKVLTDGVLLAELARDRQLRAYDTVIVDEAHERSLNIDFLLGYLKQLRARRPELRVVVSSATLDEERFSAFFDDAPVLRVPGRSHPVEVRYRPPRDGAPLAEQVRAAIDELCAEGPGDILVFLSGEREIHEVAGRLRSASGPSAEVLPLYARLPLAQQDRIFRPRSRRRIVLATNVAETSLTVPGVRYVVDAGLARIGRYSPGNAVQRLPVEPISQASARQRAGRCGREAPGICIRLYDEAAYDGFEPFTQPEIQRTDLAAVLLRMRSLGVGDLAKFPFLDPPARRHVNAGLRLLSELGAFDSTGRLSPVGRKLARLPLDPRVGRMLLAAGELDCVSEVLVIAAGLSAGDPRERERGQRGPLAQHLRFEDPRSDFLRLVRIWNHLQHHTRGRGIGTLAELCRRRRLAFSRVQEWREVHLQLSIAAREMGLHSRSRPASYARVHRALLAGLLRHVGSRREGRDYQGIHGNGFRISRASGQFDRRPRWVLAAEVVDAGSPYAHTVAGIRAEWVESAAGPLIRRSHFDAWWDAVRGEAMVHEQTALYALTVTARRKVRFAPVSREGAREVFIRGALVDGAFASAAPFLARNRALIERRRALESRLRRPDPAIAEERLYEFYHQRLPLAVCDGASFEAWWPALDATAEAELDLSRAEHWRTFREPDPEAVERDFPEAVAVSGMRLALEYRFRPGEEDDGVTVQVPRELLAALRPGEVEWALPGLLRENVVALLRALPKSMRRRLGPVRDVAEAFLGEQRPPGLGLVDALALFLHARFGVEVRGDEAWSPSALRQRLPASLRPRFRILGADGKALGAGRDLERLRARHARRRDAEGAAVEQAVHTRWDLEPLAAEVTVARGGTRGVLYPALVPSGEGVVVLPVEDVERARELHAAGLVRLALGERDLKIERIADTIAHPETLCLLNVLVPPPPSGLTLERAEADRDACRELLRELAGAAVCDAFLPPDPWRVRDRDAFLAMCAEGQPRIDDCVQEQTVWARGVLEAHRELRAALAGEWPEAWSASLDDAREQLAWLVYRGFVSETPREWRGRLPAYLRGLGVRLEKLRRGGARDGDKVARVRPLWQRFVARAAAHRARGHRDSGLARYRWMVEEFRLSVFAQELGAAHRVSRERLDRLWESIPS